LFLQLGLRADVQEHLQTLPGLSQTRRQAALAVAQAHPEDPLTLNQLAWELVKLPGRAIADYRKALRYSEEGCQLERKNGYYLNTLGVAYYRVGNYEKALATLLCSDQINKKQFGASIASDLAFLAMTEHHLRHAQKAEGYLQRLQERVKAPRGAQDAEAQGFLREAEALLGHRAK
jgi:tetratricopeptide (TPR) repeat protein